MGEQAVFNDQYYHTIFSGGVIEAGDWVVWLPQNHVSGDTGCQGAAAIAANPTFNDFIHNQDVNDHPDHYDRGGLVRSPRACGAAASTIATASTRWRTAVSGRCRPRQ